jgi:hypothetical protein
LLTRESASRHSALIEAVIHSDLELSRWIHLSKVTPGPQLWGYIDAGDARIGRGGRKSGGYTRKRPPRQLFHTASQSKFRQEATHRQITNNPFHCSECRRESGEWVYVVPGKGQRTVGRCYACLYGQFRNNALMSVARIADPAARLRGIVAAMESAKRQARYVLDLVWA